MTVIVRWLVFALALAVAAVVQFPLHLAGLDRAGVTARAARGTIWNGSLDAARMRGIPIGDVAVGLSPAALVGGGLRSDFRGGTIGGALTRRAGGAGVTGLAGTIGPLQIAGLPVAALTFEGVDIAFADGRCTLATGMVQMQPGAGIATAGSLMGPPRCDGADLLLPLASATGDTRLDVRIDGDRHYRATLARDSVAEAERPLLLAAGFKPTPGGLALTVEGSF